MKVYTIRTKDGRPVIFDTDEQILPDGSGIEFHFPDKKVALVVLLNMDHPENFEIIEHDLDPKEVCYKMDEDGLKDKLEEIHKDRRA